MRGLRGRGSPLRGPPGRSRGAGGPGPRGGPAQRPASGPPTTRPTAARTCRAAAPRTMPESAASPPAAAARHFTHRQSPPPGTGQGQRLLRRVRASQTAACSAADLAPYRRPIDCALSTLAPGHHCVAKQRHPEQQIHSIIIIPTRRLACTSDTFHRSQLEMSPLSKQKAESRKDKAETTGSGAARGR